MLKYSTTKHFSFAKSIGRAGGIVAKYIWCSRNIFAAQNGRTGQPPPHTLFAPSLAKSIKHSYLILRQFKKKNNNNNNNNK